jgi:hypothetical protein
MGHIARRIPIRKETKITARQNTAGRVILAVATGGASELMRGIHLSKDAKYREAANQALKYKNAYRKCKARRVAKGKQAWPQDKKSGFGTTNCKGDYQRWMSWEKKAADRASVLKDKLERKGKLDPDAATELDAAISAPAKSAGMEQIEDEIRSGMVRPGNTEEKLAILADREAAGLIDADYVAGEEEAEEGSSMGLMLLVVGGVVVAGGVGYMVYRH